MDNENIADRSSDRPKQDDDPEHQNTALFLYNLSEKLPFLGCERRPSDEAHTPEDRHLADRSNGEQDPTAQGQTLVLPDDFCL